mmetsp:Transcript_19779/g.40858  ORF Transcript_19779/g.40858 Transcript_19779/m.40858 type:complete len:205 (-) Transcript_19779:157-771(-)
MSWRGSSSLTASGMVIAGSSRSPRTTASLMEWLVKAYKKRMAMSPVMMNWSSGGGGTTLLRISSRKRSATSGKPCSLLPLLLGTSDFHTRLPSVSLVRRSLQEFRIELNWSSTSSLWRLEDSGGGAVLRFLGRFRKDDDEARRGAKAEAAGIDLVIANEAATNAAADKDDCRRSFIVCLFVGCCACGCACACACAFGLFWEQCC